jgi:O-antigen ligase
MPPRAFSRKAYGTISFDRLRMIVPYAVRRLGKRSKLRLALVLSLIGHGLLIITAQYRLSYDAYTHMFFADHYLRQWNTLWDPRWYAGFTVVSYPPLAHQLVALVAVFTGVDMAFALVLLIVIVSLTLAVYAFARIFLGPDGAGYTALGAAILPSIYLSAYVFGQLPTLMGLLFALLALASLAQFLRFGRRLYGVLTIALLATVVAAHHATLLFLPWAAAAVILHLLLNRQVTLRAMLVRLLAIGVPSIVAMLAVIWPFWLWGLGQTMQTPIDHLSRHNFLTDWNAVSLFFLPIYGLLVCLIPYALRHMARRRLLAPALLFLLLLVLGLGGTTPIPRWLFGAGWAWLTYDRFAIWASFVLLIFFGRFALQAQRWLGKHLVRIPGAHKLGYYGVFSVLVLSAHLFPTLFPTQPQAVDMRPIATFLNQGDHAHWRYLTFGFGDQFASLSQLTNATTIDGSYHTARNLPMLRQSGIGQIDTVYWSDKGVDALDPILDQSSDYSVRWGFVDHRDYVPVLVRHGWMLIAILTNQIEVWENPGAITPVTQNTAPADDPLQLISWQFFPLFALLTAGTLSAATISAARVRQVLLGLHTLVVALLPISLCFWFYQQFVETDYQRIYLGYTNALGYGSDGLALAAVILWALARLIGSGTGAPRRPTAPAVVWLTRVLFAFCALATLSVLWSVEPRISLYFSLHLWLLFGLYYSLADNPPPIHRIVLSASTALAIEAGIGFTESILQSTVFLTPLHLKLSGLLTPSLPGSSVVQLANGIRWLRVYGTLPHPNILGGLLMLLLVGPVAWLLLGRRLRWLAALLVIAGMALLCLTFSRAAWLGCIAAGIVIAFHHRRFQRTRLIALAAAACAGLLIVALPLARQVFTRVADLNVPTEQLSIDDRVWLTGQSLLIMRDHPILGVGIGGFEVALSQRDTGTYPIEPVHSLYLLAGSELGIPGVLLLAVMVVILAIATLRARQPDAVVISAVVAGLLVTALFDHYLWTLAPGRILLWMALGLWSGCILARIPADGQNGQQVRSAIYHRTLGR